MEAEHSSAQVGKVLVIDDDDLIVEVFRLMLSRHYEVECVMTGADALASLRDISPYRAVVCDLQLPDMDGRAIYEALEREGRRDILDVMIFCTGGSADPVLEDFLDDVGRDRVVNKPCRVQELLEAIERISRPSGAS